MPSVKYKHLSLFARKQQVGNYGMMIGIRVDDLFALQHLKVCRRKNIIDPQGGGNMDIGPAGSEVFGYEGILPASPDMKISIGIRNIIEIPANDYRVRARIQVPSYGIGLVSAEAERIF